MNNLQVADFRDREVEGDLDFGRNLGNWGEIRVGFHRINGQTYDRYGSPDFVEPQYNNGEYFFKFSYDQLDNVHFPARRHDVRRAVGCEPHQSRARISRSTRCRSIG